MTEWPTECQRCGAALALTAHGCSWFNRDICCLDCLHDERECPGFEAAHDAEVAQVQAKNFNYEGVGLSDADKAHLAARLAARGLTPRFT